MGIFKGVLSIILILFLSLSSLLQVTASDFDNSLNNKKYAVKQIILAKNTLLKTKNGVKYINSIDILAEKLKSNPQKLEKTSKKVNKVIYKLQSKKYSGESLSRNEQVIINILTYLQKRIRFIELDNLEKEKSEKEDAINIILEAAKNPNISDSDKKKVNSAIINIQEKLLDTAEKNVSNILSDFEKYYNYENKGDFKMSYNINQEKIGKINAEMKFSDYIIQNNNFDTRVKGKLSALFKASSQDDKITQGEISSIIDFIAKEGNYFALLKDLNITTDKNIESIQEIIDTLKKLAKENKYIEISDPANQKLMEIIQSFNPDLFFKDARKFAQKPMFTAYKKEGNTYSILPTKYACDTIKDIANKFDPFNPKNCSESQYNNFISDMLSVGELTLTLGSENTLSYKVFPDRYTDEATFSISYNSKDITKITANIIPNQVKNPNEKATFEYKKDNYLNAYMYAEKGDINLKFESTLDKRNNFTAVNYSQDIIDRDNTIFSRFNLKNRKFTGELISKIQKRKYDYKSGKYIQQGESVIELKVSGKTNSFNNIDTLKITINGKDNNEIFLDGIVDYKKNKTKLDVMYNSARIESNIKFDGRWDSRNKTFSQFDSNIEILSKQREYNSDTYTYESTGEKTKTFVLNYKLNNKKVIGNIGIWDKQGESIIKIDSKGTYEKNKLQLNNNIDTNLYTIYAGQVDKARDSKRISDLKMLQTAIEQTYQDEAEYPTIDNFNEKVSKYIWKIPTDPKGNIEINGCKFGYYYEVGEDKYGIKNGEYKISTCLESTFNTSKLTNDGGNISNKLEFGLNIPKTKANGFYINDIKSWEKMEATKNPENPKINLNFGYDYTNNNSNIDIFTNVIYEGNKIFEFMLKNKGTIEYKKVDIKKPTNSIPYKEAFPSKY